MGQVKARSQEPHFSTLSGGRDPQMGLPLQPSHIHQQNAGSEVEWLGLQQVTPTAPAVAQLTAPQCQLLKRASIFFFIFKIIIDSQGHSKCIMMTM